MVIFKSCPGTWLVTHTYGIFIPGTRLVLASAVAEQASVKNRA